MVSDNTCLLSHSFPGSRIQRLAELSGVSQPVTKELARLCSHLECLLEKCPCPCSHGCWQHSGLWGCRTENFSHLEADTATCTRGFPLWQLASSQKNQRKSKSERERERERERETETETERQRLLQDRCYHLMWHRRDHTRTRTQWGSWVGGTKGPSTVSFFLLSFLLS
jgi:hypothetical protein